MSKLIKLSDGRIINMTFEEVLLHYNNMLKMFYYKWHKSIPIEKDDLKQEINMYMYQSYKYYNRLDICFSTFSHTIINRQLCKYYRSNYLVKNKKALVHSLNNIISCTVECENEDVEYIELLKDEYILDEDVAVRLDFINEYSKLKQLHKQAITLLKRGYSQDKVAEILGCSQRVPTYAKNKLLNAM